MQPVQYLDDDDVDDDEDDYDDDDAHTFAARVVTSHDSDAGKVWRSWKAATRRSRPRGTNETNTTFDNTTIIHRLITYRRMLECVC